MSALYRMIKLPIPNKTKFKMFLNLEWIFDRLSHEMSFKVYQPHEHPIRNYAKQFILDQITADHVVLDLGCNLGDMSDFIAGKAKKVVGLDCYKQAIESAQARYNRSNLVFVHGDACEYLQSCKEQFDVLIMSHILEHLDSPKDFLLRFQHLFQYIYIEVPDFDRYLLNHYRKNLDMPLIYSDNDHVTEFDRRDLDQLLKDCGLETLRSECIFGVLKYWCKVGENTQLKVTGRT